METYPHFGLRAAPFDGRPDPQFFYGTPAFAETLATLQYAVGSGKAAALVLGESGSGKTLLGRVLVQRLGTRSDILWLRGLGQPPGKTMASVICSRGTFAPGVCASPSGTEIPLTQWLRATRTGPLRRQGSTATLIVDDADGLRANAWEDILALIADPPFQNAAPRVSAVIFGLPALLDSVRRSAAADRSPAGPFVRLQRRLFRVCHVDALTAEDVTGYIRHRLAAAGGPVDLFTPPALALVYELSEGNPALINQLCDNALVEAFGEDGPRVDTPHVLAAVRSVTGQVERQDAPVDGEPCEHFAPASRLVHEESLLLARMRSIAGPVAGASPHPGDPLRERLHSLQARLSEALSRVRSARLPT